MENQTCINGHEKTPENIVDGYRCRICRSDQSKRSREKHKETRSSDTQIWVEQNRGKSKDIKSKWADENKEKVAESNKLYREKNKERIKEKRKEKHNHDKRMHRKNVRRTKIKETSTEILRVADLHKEAGGVCYLCQKHIDLSLQYPNPLSASQEHITPIKNGGRHIKSNVTVTHLVCNLRKGTS